MFSVSIKSNLAPKAGRTSRRKTSKCSEICVCWQNGIYAFLLAATAAWSIWTGGMGASQLLKYRYLAHGQKLVSTAVLDSPWKLPGLGEVPGAVGLDQAGWSFPGCNLRVLSSAVDDQQLASTFADFAACPIESRFEDDVASESGTAIIQLMREAGARRREMDGLVVYSLDHESIRARVITKLGRDRHDAEQFRGGLLAQKSEAKVWSLWGLAPAHTSSFADDSHLMPLPEGSQTICRRVADSGNTLMELVDTEHGPEQLLGNWRADGWEVTAASDNIPPGTLHHVCKRHTNVILVWSAQGDDQETRLMLTRGEGVVDSENLLAGL